MAKFPIWATIRVASADVWARKQTAARIWGVNLGFLLVAMAPSLFGPKGILLSQLLQPAMVVVIGWMMARWAAAVVQRTTGSATASDYFWPTVRGVIKIYVLMILALITVAVLFVFAAVFTKLSHPAGGAMTLVAIAATGVALWAGIRLSLLPSLASIGEGTSIKLAWRRSNGLTTNLLGLALAAWLVFAATFLLIVGVAFGAAILGSHFGWLQLPDLSDPAAIRDFNQSRFFRGAIMIIEVVAAPAMAWAYLTLIGAYVRVALQLSGRASTPIAVPANPWIG